MQYLNSKLDHCLLNAKIIDFIDQGYDRKGNKKAKKKRLKQDIQHWAKQSKRIQGQNIGIGQNRIEAKNVRAERLFFIGG